MLAWQRSASKCAGETLVQRLEMRDQKNWYTLMWLTIARYTHSENKPTRLWWVLQECTAWNIAVSHYFWPQKKSQKSDDCIYLLRNRSNYITWTNIGKWDVSKSVPSIWGHYNSLSRIVFGMPKQILWSKPNRQGFIVSEWETVARLNLSVSPRYYNINTTRVDYV